MIDKNEFGGYLQIARHRGRAGLLHGTDGPLLGPGFFVVGELDVEGGALRVAQQTHGAVADSDGYGARSAGEGKVVAADEVIDGPGVVSGLKRCRIARIERLAESGGKNRQGSEYKNGNRGAETAGAGGLHCAVS